MHTESRYVEVDGRKIYVETAGEGPVLVLGHAAFIDSRQWSSQWEPFAAKYRVVRYDMAGYGKSDPVTGPTPRVSELRGVMDALGIDRAALLGCSMSGSTIVDFALASPERVTALMPFNAVHWGFPWEGEEPPIVQELTAALQARDVDRAAELEMRIWIDGVDRSPEQVDPGVRTSALEMAKIALRNRTFELSESQMQEPEGTPPFHRLGEIKAPFLAIVGEFDEPETIRAGKMMAEKVPQGEYVLIRGGAHVPNMDNPADFNEAVLSFLDRRHRP